MSSNFFAYISRMKLIKRWGIDLLSGTDELRMNQKSADEIVKEWSEEARAFGDVRERYGLYK